MREREGEKESERENATSSLSGARRVSREESTCATFTHMASQSNTNYLGIIGRIACTFKLITY